MSTVFAATSAEFITEAELCQRLGVSTRMAARRRPAGGDAWPPFVRIGLRRIGYRRADVDAWIARRTYPHTAAEMARKAA